MRQATGRIGDCAALSSQDGVGVGDPHRQTVARCHKFCVRIAALPET